jgi:hypothetical protein
MLKKALSAIAIATLALSAQAADVLKVAPRPFLTPKSSITSSPH